MAIGEESDLLTVAEAAGALKVSPVTIRRWLKQGRLAALRVGPRSLRIPRAELGRVTQPRENFVEERDGRKFLHTPSGIVVPLPTPEEIERRKEAIARADELRAEILRARGGVPLPSSWEIIRDARDERGNW